MTTTQQTSPCPYCGEPRELRRRQHVGGAGDTATHILPVHTSTGRTLCRPMVIDNAARRHAQAGAR